MALSKEDIVKAAQRGVVKTADFVKQYRVSRQHVNYLISQLVHAHQLVKLGSTRAAFYVTPDYLEQHLAELPTSYKQTVNNVQLEEHKILNKVERQFIPLNNLPENIKSIFTYAFSEMLNNAIEHSKTNTIDISVSLQDYQLIFIIDDYGVGVFRNIMQKRKLKNELEAIQDLLKGKTTTAPKLHSGEGIFFTSKIADKFMLDSHGLQLLIDNTIDDVFVKKVPGQKQGTRVTFRIDQRTNRHLNDVFKQYTSTEGGDYGFDKTEIRVKLYTMGGVHISRSQARRVLSGLQKFHVIVMDYDAVPMVGQAFADEVYRVFKDKYPSIQIKNENMNEGVAFMVKRAMSEAAK